VSRFLSLTIVFLLACGSPCLAATNAIPFVDLGYANDLTLTGPNPRFTLFVPVYSQLKSVRIRIPLRFSSVMDPRSTITMSVNDRILSTTTLGAMGANPIFDRNIEVPPGTRGALQIALTGRFFEKGDVCFDLDTDNFWMTVGRGGVLTVTTAALSHAPFVRDFLNDYGGSIAVVAPANLGDGLRDQALRLAYYLHQSNRWRHTVVSLVDRTDPGARNIVLGDFPKALEIRGSDLYANGDGVALLRRRLAELLVTDRVESASNDAKPPDDVREQTFEGLGFPSQTQTGTGELPFLIPLQFARVGGMPDDLHLHLALTHTPVLPEERAFVKVLVNGTLVRSFEFRGDGGQETYDVPIGPDVLRGSNDVRIVPTYFYRHDACKGSYPRMTATLLGTSSFSWGSINRQAESVGDFFNLASGRVAVLLGSPSDLSYAFALLDAAGTINTSIRDIDVKPYDGTIPSGYDYAIVVAAPEQLSGVSLPLSPSASNFALRDGSGNAAYHAQFAQPFGVLEVDGKGSPALYATYWKDRSATAGLARIAPAELAEQTGEVFLFDAERATYSSNENRPHYTATDPLRRWLPLVLTVFSVLLITLIVITARRARNAS
jgi:Bacterial cellulose synthase subunit